MSEPTAVRPKAGHTPTRTALGFLEDADVQRRAVHALGLDDDTEQACRRTVTALTALPADYRTGLVRHRARDL
ncbi:hypothetical protein [Streptomyces sp. NPDC005374]|uniref:hypothetical protein n=1 Tax=Streptomyces sp. NPDC005374 TaxID=3364713 RepID=UPI0036952E24